MQLGLRQDVSVTSSGNCLRDLDTKYLAKSHSDEGVVASINQLSQDQLSWCLRALRFNVGTDTPIQAAEFG